MITTKVRNPRKRDEKIGFFLNIFREVRRERETDRQTDRDRVRENCRTPIASKGLPFCEYKVSIYLFSTLKLYLSFYSSHSLLQELITLPFQNSFHFPFRSGALYTTFLNSFFIFLFLLFTSYIECALLFSIFMIFSFMSLIYHLSESFIFHILLPLAHDSYTIRSLLSPQCPFGT